MNLCTGNTGAMSTGCWEHTHYEKRREKRFLKIHHEERIELEERWGRCYIARWWETSRFCGGTSTPLDRQGVLKAFPFIDFRYLISYIDILYCLPLLSSSISSIPPPLLLPLRQPCSIRECKWWMNAWIWSPVDFCITALLHYYIIPLDTAHPLNT